MNTKKNAATGESEHLVEDAQTLLGATAHIAEEKVVEARRRLTSALERGREVWGEVREKAVAGAKATDQVVRDHPYHAMGVAFGVGALLGFLLSRRN